MLDGMSDSIQRSRIENLHSREVDRQSPTGLIFLGETFDVPDLIWSVKILLQQPWRFSEYTGLISDEHGRHFG